MATDNDFWDEIQRVLCPQFKEFGRNWNAFIDILRGGFLTFDYQKKIIVKFKNRKFAKKQLGKTFEKAIKIMEETENIQLELV